MADAKQCDVCGRLFPGFGHIAFEGDRYSDSITLTKLELNNNHLVFKRTTTGYDCCPGCYGKIVALIAILQKGESDES